jgi:hypothetical protein
MYDDLCIDDENGLAYVTVHRQNRIDRAPIEADGEAVRPIAGEPLDEMLLGPNKFGLGAHAGRVPACRVRDDGRRINRVAT